MEAFADPETISKGRWQWKSNPNPWDKKETPQWKFYPLEHNYLIEKAYYEKKHDVDIGDYIVSIDHMIQTKKGSVVSQRSIKRINWIDNPEEIDRSERYIETELPKTINKVFGSLGDFISFFSRRNPEILEFTKDFKDAETSNDLDILNHKIVPKLVNCLEGVLVKPNEEELQDPLLTIFRKKLLLQMKERIEELISLFQKESLNLEEFYGRVLRAYTMDTDLYSHLNNDLRNENWAKIDKLLPYVICLCKAFFNSSLKKDSAQDKGNKTPSPMFLYRGTAFDELSLSFYDTKKVQYFSWNSVTSTTKSKDIAEEFMYKSADLANKKYPIIFVIEVPLTSEFESEYLKWIDIHQYSAIPKEDEVVFPPGSVFELIEVSTDEDKRTTLKIKLRNEIKSLAHGGMMMQGALQSHLMTEKEAKIMCLEGEELHQALMSISGNKLIEEIEFCLCLFDKKFLSKMHEIFPTLERGKRLKIIACSSEDNGEIKDEEPVEGERCGITKLEVIGASNFFQMICNEKRDQKYWVALRELDLDFRSQQNLKNEELDEVSQGLKYLPQLASLNINFEWCSYLTDEGVNNLAESLSSLTQLAHLNLNFQYCKMTDEAANNLAKAISALTNLTHLNINFRDCEQITVNGMNTLASQGLRFLSQLKSLDLGFDSIENARLLSQGLRNLTQLASLTLDCLVYGDKELNSFVFDGLKHLLQLTSLTLQFTSLTFQYRLIKYFNITDKGLEVFASQGLKSLASLTSLNLKFVSFGQITDKGLHSLASQGLKHLIQLKSLALKFDNSHQITEKGVSWLMSQGLQNLTHLTSLSLGFPDCFQIEEEGMKILASKWLRNLFIFEFLAVQDSELITVDTQPQQKLRNSSRVKLTRESSQKYNQSRAEEFSVLLSENHNLKMVSNSSKLFKQSEKPVSQNLLDKLIPIFQKKEDRTHNPHSTLKAFEIFPEIRRLTSLNLSFKIENRKIITDEFVHNLASQVLRHSPQLKFLTLNFDSWDQITDRGVSDLALYGLKSLTVLASLTLTITSTYFLWIPITDKGMFDLALYGLKSLVNLASCNLYFGRCSQITDKGIVDLASEGLRHLSQLKSLDLSFIQCERITEKGMVNLARNGLIHLSQLQSLALKPSFGISDEGMRDLALHGLKPLADLASLSLDFSECRRLTDKGMIDLTCEGLSHLSQLKFLVLKFRFCKELTYEGWTYLAWNGLRHLSQLESLFLHPSLRITDQGVDSVMSQGFKYLTQLKSLSFDFFGLQLTDKGVNNLILQIVKNLPQLTSLDLDFRSAENMSDLTIQNIIKVLHYFGFTKEIDEIEEADEMMKFKLD